VVFKVLLQATLVEKDLRTVGFGALVLLTVPTVAVDDTVLLQVGLCDEAVSTFTATEGLHSCVHHGVSLEVRDLRLLTLIIYLTESPSTLWILATVGPVPSVCSHMFQKRRERLYQLLTLAVRAAVSIHLALPDEDTTRLVVGA